MRRLIAAAAAAIATAGVTGAAHAETSCADVGKSRLAHVEITSAAEIEVGGKPACQLTAISRPTADSEIRIEVVIPRGEAWNEKYVQVGNGGLAGQVPSAQIKAMAEKGYAAAGTDDGHVSSGRTAAWALGHPEKVKDFAWRSLKETTDAAKALITAQKGTPLARSYFVGCSAGGREALMEAQRFPNDFDGIVSGAAANYNTLGTAGRVYMMQALNQPGGYLDQPALELLDKAALKQCAAGGPFIRDQAACRFDPVVLQCKAGQKDGCLSPAQVASARAIRSGRMVNGRSVFPGYMPGAASLAGGYQSWITGPALEQNGRAAGWEFSSEVMKYFIYNDPGLDILKSDVGAKYDRDRVAPAKVIDAVDPDISTFVKHGGKLIQYHGWNDPGIAPLGSVRYRSELMSRMGDVGGFYRLYMIPGMLHCAGGAGPNVVDWVTVMDDWVSHSKAPASLVATAGGNKQAKAQSQLICPYPQVAKGGSGDTATGWRCEGPKKSKKG